MDTNHFAFCPLCRLPPVPPRRAPDIRPGQDIPNVSPISAGPAHALPFPASELADLTWDPIKTCLLLRGDQERARLGLIPPLFSPKKKKRKNTQL